MSISKPSMSSQSIDVVYLLLPKSRRGTNRNLVIPAYSFDLGAALAGEAYAYQYCKAYGGWGRAYENLHDHQPLVYMGAILTQDMFETEEWKLAWPKRLRPLDSDKRHFQCMFTQHDESIMVVDRYGHPHHLNRGESIEPIDWVVPSLHL